MAARSKCQEALNADPAETEYDHQSTLILILCAYGVLRMLADAHAVWRWHYAKPNCLTWKARQPLNHRIRTLLSRYMSSYKSRYCRHLQMHTSYHEGASYNSVAIAAT